MLYSASMIPWFILALVIGVIVVLIGVVWWQIGRALMGAMGYRRQVPEGTPSLLVDQLRRIDEAMVLCGVRRLEQAPDAEQLAGRFGVFVDGRLAEQVARTIEQHRRSAHFRRDTTRVLAVPLGAIEGDCRARLLEYGTDGRPVRSAMVDLSMAFIEVAGPEADPAHRCDHDGQILMYPPDGTGWPATGQGGEPDTSASETGGRARPGAAAHPGPPAGSIADGS